MDLMHWSSLGKRHILGWAISNGDCVDRTRSKLNIFLNREFKPWSIDAASVVELLKGHFDYTNGFFDGKMSYRFDSSLRHPLDI